MNGSEVIPPTIFKDMVQQLEEKSLLINEILETFLAFPEKDRNKTKTHAMKMECGNHALSGLVAIMTNQKFPSNFQLFFVLLYILYGSGKQFINMLSSIGLSFDWGSLQVSISKCSFKVGVVRGSGD